MFPFFRKTINRFKNFGLGKRFNSTVLDIKEYSKSLQFFHWFQAIAFSGLVASGYKASTMKGELSTEEKKFKGDLMRIHKSMGLLMFGAMFPRIFFRLTTRIPKAPNGPIYERLAGSLSHAVLYGGIIIMPLTGVTFGYLSGYGLPFFGLKTFEGASKETRDKEISKTLRVNAFKLHQKFGTILEFLLPIHVGAVGFHYLVRGENLLKRMNIFSKRIIK